MVNVFDQIRESIHEYRKDHYDSDPAVFIHPDTKKDMERSGNLIYAGQDPDSGAFGQHFGAELFEDDTVDGFEVKPESLDDYRPEEYFESEPPQRHVETFIEKMGVNSRDVDFLPETARNTVLMPFRLEKKVVSIHDYVKNADRLPVTGRKRYDWFEEEGEVVSHVEARDLDGDVREMETEVKVVPISQEWARGNPEAATSMLARKAINLQNQTITRRVRGERRFEFWDVEAEPEEDPTFDSDSEHFYEGTTEVVVGKEEFYLGNLALFPHLAENDGWRSP
jgi:hypothetical protein